MRPTWRRELLIAALVVALPAASFGPLVAGAGAAPLSQGSAGCVPTKVASFEVPGPGIGGTGVVTSEWKAQGFRISAPIRLVRVSLQLVRFAPARDSFAVLLQRDSLGLPGDAIGVGSGLSPAVQFEPTWVDFTLAPADIVLPPASYHLVAGKTSDTAGLDAWRSNDAGGYDDGAMSYSQDVGRTWAPLSSPFNPVDALFQIWGCPAPSTTTPLATTTPLPTATATRPPTTPTADLPTPTATAALVSSTATVALPSPTATVGGIGTPTATVALASPTAPACPLGRGPVPCSTATAASTPQPTSGATLPPTVSPVATATRTPTPGLVGGRGLTLQALSTGVISTPGPSPTPASVRLSWRPGSLQTGYLVIRWSPTSGFSFLPRFDQFVPGGNTSFEDVGPLPDPTYCYVLLVLGGTPASLDSVLGISDMHCVYPGSGVEPGAPRDFAVRLNETQRADLTWSAPGGQAGYELTAIRFDGTLSRTFTLGPGVAAFSDETGGQTTCYQLRTLPANPQTGRTAQVCAAPGIASFSAGNALQSVTQRFERGR